jgi:diketogulonate reductase-like aldo/keto reductase
MAYSPVGQAGALLRNHALNVIAKNHDVSSAQVALPGPCGNLLLQSRKLVLHDIGNLQADGLKLGAEELEAINQAFPPPGKKQPLAML